MSHLIAYLDEFGHIGPYIARDHEKYQESPVFGLGGFIIPSEKAREFSTWFYQRKNQLLAWELGQSGKHPAYFEKKGSSLYTAQNVERYAELTRFTNRLYNSIPKFQAQVFFVGQKKTKAPADHDADALYANILQEVIKRLNQHATEHDTKFMIVLDQHASREKIITTASLSMFGHQNADRLIEPPFQVESHRYQTIQAADWICGLIGRLGAYWAEPDQWADMIWAKEKFQDRVIAAAIRSGINTR